MLDVDDGGPDEKFFNLLAGEKDASSLVLLLAPTFPMPLNAAYPATANC